MNWLHKIVFLIFGGGALLAATALDTRCVATNLENLGYTTQSRQDIISKEFQTSENYKSGEISIPDNAKRMAIALDRNSWEVKGVDSTVVVATMDFFNGKEWILNMPLFSSTGGEALDECGVGTQSFHEDALLKGTGRMVKVNVISKNTLPTTVSIYFQ